MKLLVPLVRILLRNGISYRAFCELTKKAYVDVASNEFTIPGRKQTTSRVAVLTGLSRKEVKRVSELTGLDDLDATGRYNRAVRVINGWRNDLLFLNSSGNPKELYFDSGELSFSSLVKAYSGDMPARAMLDEMLRTGAVDMEENRIRLMTKGYIVQKGEAEKINIMGTDAGELISTIHHNIVHDPSEALFQRKASYDNIPEDLLPEMRENVARMSEEFIDSVNMVISGYDRDVNPRIKGKGKRKAGLGIFYFQ